MVKTPMLVSSLMTQKIINVEFNENHSVALSSNNLLLFLVICLGLGIAYTWGFALDGSLG